MKRNYLATTLLASLLGSGLAMGATEAELAQQFSGINLSKSYKPQSNHNPLFTQRFGADPCAMVYNDEVYIYMTNDILEYKDGALIENTYSKITTINCVSSKDMVNWTDHGTMDVAKTGPARWAGCSWAPSACHKMVNGKEKFFLYFANSGGGIGVVTSDCPWGPWTDPIGNALISSRTPGCQGVIWLFDPAVLVDDDGTAYVYCGGGVPDNNKADPGTARVAKLGKDFISVDGTLKTIRPPYLFEDAGINKIGDTYVYSYCINWNTGGNNLGISNAQIGYMTSKKPMEDFVFKGVAYKNQAEFLDRNKYGDNGGNNHHSIFEFKGKWYMTYHARLLQNAMGICPGKNLNYRSTHVDYINVNTSNATITKSEGSAEGVKQVGSLNPFERTEAETMAWMGGIDTRYGGSNMLVTKIDRGDWIGLAGVDFASGAGVITANVSSQKAGAIKICLDKVDGPVVGYVDVPNTGGSLKEVTCKLSTTVTDKHDLFFVFSGEMEFDWWVFKADGPSISLKTTESVIWEPGEVILTPSLFDANPSEIVFYQDGNKIGTATSAPFTYTAQNLTAGTHTFYAQMTVNGKTYTSSEATVKIKAVPGPYKGIAQVIPGTIEVENFNEGEEGDAYHDSDDVNEGGQYRECGVDIDASDEGGYVIGWTQKGEWLDYTIDVKYTDTYNWTARVASGLSNSAFKLYVDGEAITDVVTVPNTEPDKWSVYENISGKTTKAITAGKHVLRLSIEGSYCNIDHISFHGTTTGVKEVDNATEETYVVYTTLGAEVGSITMRGIDMDALSHKFNQGTYVLTNVKGGNSQLVIIR